MSVTIALLLWLLPIIVNIYMDRNGAKRNYLQVNTIRGIALIVHGAVCFDMDGGNFLMKDIIRNTPIIVFYFTSYWLFFEAGLNYVRGRIEEQGGFWKGILYYDRSEGDSGWIDGFFADKPKAHTVAKVVSLIAMILSIIIIYKQN